uniref:SCP domain-containing protein n=2 Tax=Mesocestoides corti TaxID=53468 RepID=A0A5K3ER09_MESCO
MWTFVFLLAASWCAMAKNTTDEDRAKILEQHILMRESVSPSASDMQLLRYSTHLESLALQWTANCLRKTANSTLLPNHTNTAVTWINFQGSIVMYDSIISVFGNGLQNYFYENNTCTGYCVLGLQVIWSNTTAVGCASTYCSNSQQSTGQHFYLVACVYQPAGNIPNLRPYKNGTSCSSCPNGFFCHRKQCTNDTSLLPNTTTTSSTATPSTTTNTTTVAIGTSSSMTTTTSASANTNTVATGKSSSMTTISTTGTTTTSVSAQVPAWRILVFAILLLFISS